MICVQIFFSKNTDEWNPNYLCYSEASRALNGAAFKVYVLLKGYYDDGYEDYNLSPTAFSEEFGISDTSVYRGIKELQDKGYLKKNEDSYYFFIRVPQNDK